MFDILSSFHNLPKLIFGSRKNKGAEQQSFSMYGLETKLMDLVTMS